MLSLRKYHNEGVKTQILLVVGMVENVAGWTVPGV
jgi:hypothetical protein